MGKPIQRHRKQAFLRQGGRCFYCGLPMWQSSPEELAAKTGLRPRALRCLQCTAEHLKARRDGGGNSSENIAAACMACNQRRHARLSPPDPDAYMRLVRSRMDRGRWHHAALHGAVARSERPVRDVEPNRADPRASTTCLQ